MGLMRQMFIPHDISKLAGKFELSCTRVHCYVWRRRTIELADCFYHHSGHTRLIVCAWEIPVKTCAGDISKKSNPATTSVWITVPPRTSSANAPVGCAWKERIVDSWTGTRPDVIRSVSIGHSWCPESVVCNRIVQIEPVVLDWIPAVKVRQTQS
jgi:hypothetical protein